MRGPNMEQDMLYRRCDFNSSTYFSSYGKWSISCSKFNQNWKYAQFDFVPVRRADACRHISVQLISPAIYVMASVSVNASCGLLAEHTCEPELAYERLGLSYISR